MTAPQPFRDPAAAHALTAKIRRAVEPLAGTGRILRFMEVCGSHTMAVARYGIRSLLPPAIKLISGPGCPVCVTGSGYIDAAIALAGRGIVIHSFGDLLRVPGSAGSLAECRATGADIRVCYSPVEALEAAAREPNRQHVFLAIGFETTTAPVVSLLTLPAAAHMKNLSLLTAWKTIPQALEILARDPALKLDGFLCPPHVSAIIGSHPYEALAARTRRPFVVAGFEPLDILYGLFGLAEQAVAGTAKVDNQYSRVVRPGGNVAALKIMDTYLEPDDAEWRGLGRIPGSGLRLKPAYRVWDAAARFAITVPFVPEPRGCRCGEVLKGLCAPWDCPLFGTACTPERPVGACMVSVEGSCAAAQRYGAGA